MSADASDIAVFVRVVIFAPFVFMTQAVTDLWHAAPEIAEEPW
jgi:hypothetical protein